MNKLKDYAMYMTALMMAAGKNGYFDDGLTSYNNEPKLYCKHCCHCPEKGKTFCKAARHQTTPNTIANKCNYFKD